MGRPQVTGLDLAHVDLEGARVAVLRKGKRERLPLRLPRKTVVALVAWVEARGREPGLRFTGFGRTRGEQLEPDGLYRLVRTLGRRVGVVGLRTHKIRHSAITAARRLAREQGIAVEEVLDFSGHADVKTFQVYLDRDRSRHGEIAALGGAEAF